MPDQATNQQGVDSFDLRESLKGYLDRQDEPAPKPEDEENVDEVNEDKPDEEEEEVQESDTDANVDDEEEDDAIGEDDESGEEEEDEDELEGAEETLGEADLQKKITVTSDNQEFSITVEEAGLGYLRNEDYTVKTQELARLKGGVVQEAEQLKQGLRMVDAFMVAELKPFEELDWTGLKDSDPNQYLIKRDEYQSAVERIRGLRQTFQNVAQGQTQHQQQLIQDQAQKEAKIIIDYEPKLKTNKAEVTQAWSKYAVEMGYTEAEINSAIDHRLFILVDKAMKFDALQKKGAKIKSKKIPKSGKRVAKGSQGDKKVSKNQRVMQGAIENFNKRQDVTSAAALLAIGLNKQRN